jgi:microcompartment protein CcmL/EutN
MQQVTFTGPSLALFELESLARGVVVADALVKQARVHLAVADAVTPGKYLLIFTGDVGEVEEAWKVGLEVGGAMVIDKLLLPHVAEAIPAAILGSLARSTSDDATGLVETHTVAAALLAADTALKRANVRLTHLQLARGIGGKGWFMLAGAQHDVEAALEGVAAVVQPPLLVATELIHRPHAELRGRVIS